MKRGLAAMTARLKAHRPLLLIAPLAILMTWPALFHVFETETFWLPSDDHDIWKELWDAWHAERMLAGDASYFFSARLFHPNGISLVYHHFSLPPLLLVRALHGLMPVSNAYTLVFLLTVGANAGCAYLYLQRLFRGTWLSLVGTLVFSCSPFVLTRSHQPDLIWIGLIPLSLHLLDRGLREESWPHILLSSAVMAATLLIGMYIFVCLMLTVGLLALAYCARYWRQRDFWLRLAVLLLIVGLCAAIRVYPYLADAAGLATALDKLGGGENNNDLMSFFLNPVHPLLTPLQSRLFNVSLPYLNGFAYLGYGALFLIAFGFARGRGRRAMLPWLLLLAFFALLRLGSTLNVADVSYPHIRLPKHYLDAILPQIFAPFWNTADFHIGALLPLAVLSCFGLRALLERLPQRHHRLVCIAALLLLAFDYYQPSRTLTLPRAQEDFLAWLAAEDGQDEIHLIHLPLGSRQSKLYDYFQTVSGYPHVEGFVSRLPPSAYDYIEANRLLRTWRREQPAHCLPALREAYQAALDQLEADQFSHIVLHHWRGGSGRIAEGFAGIAPAYADGYTRVYRLEQLRAGCEAPELDLPGEFGYLERLAGASGLVADGGTTLLSYQPDAALDAATLGYLGRVFQGWKRFLHVTTLDGDLGRALAENQLVVLAYDPRRETGIAELRAALEQDFTPCQRIVDRADASAQYFIRADYACALIDAAAPFRVDYGELRLRNLRYEIADGRLTVESWWTRLPAEAHGVSIQVFTETGEKIAGGDIVVNHEPLARHSIDLPATASDAISLQLVVYNYATRASLPGELLSSGARFERELEIGRIGLGAP